MTFSKKVKKELSEINNKRKNEAEENVLLRNFFLESGTITEPKLAYHLGIRLKDEVSLEACKKILEKYDIKTNVMSADKKYTLYIEEGDSISNFLALIGAKKSMLEFEETRVLKEISNNVNRQNNLENANLSRTITSSVKQINYIKLIKKKRRINLMNLQKKSKTWQS